jgi:hypothetical protein
VKIEIESQNRFNREHIVHGPIMANFRIPVIQDLET